MKIVNSFKLAMCMMTILLFSNVCLPNNNFNSIVNISNMTDTSMTAKELLKNSDLILHDRYMPVDTASIQWIHSKKQQQKMLDVINSKSEPLLARLLAIVVLKNNGNDYVFSVRKETLIALMVEALKKNSTGYYSDWGFIGNYSITTIGGTERLKDQDLGMAGSVFEMIGKDAIPELVPLLNNPDPVVYKAYNSSIKSEGKAPKQNSDFDAVDTKDGARWHSRESLWNTLRIKDFAALYISTIMNYKLDFDDNPLKRDEAITKMQNELHLN